jgi:hypothetical protein
VRRREFQVVDEEVLDEALEPPVALGMGRPGDLETDPHALAVAVEDRPLGGLGEDTDLATQDLRLLVQLGPQVRQALLEQSQKGAPVHPPAPARCLRAVCLFLAPAARRCKGEKSQ